MSDEQHFKRPVSLPNYSIGMEGQPTHFNASSTREEAAAAAASLRVGDAAFIKRSDLKWTYALVTERNVTNDGVTLRFEVDDAKNRKSFPDSQWGKYIRVISVKEDTKSDATLIVTEVAAATEEKSVISKTSAKSSKSKSSKSSKKDNSDVKSISSVKSKLKSFVGASAKPKAKESEVPATVVEEMKEEAGDVEIQDSKAEENATGAIVVTCTEAAGAVALTEETEKTKEEEALAGDKTHEIDIAASKVDTQPVQADKPSGGWFSSIFGSSPKPEIEKVEAETVTTTANVETEIADDVTPIVEATSEAHRAYSTPSTAVIEAPIKTVTTPESSVKVTLNSAVKTTPESSNKATDYSAIDARDDKASKENDPETSKQFAVPKPFLPTPSTKAGPTIKRNPSNVLKFKFGKSPAPISPSGRAVTMTSPPMSPIGTPSTPSKGKEWFDPEASECDYDKNPTDLFQALEAREFEYAFEMYEQLNDQFTRDCKTWVIAKGLQKGQQLRFRALPLHAAIVFDAPDELIIKILRAYPKATRGRDVKGRLPIHLAFEHQTSDHVIALIIDAFPKGFFALDKKEMTPLDHINGNTTRSYMAKYIPQIIASKVEDEREKWNVETNMLLEHQKATLQNDEEFMADVIQHVQEEVEAHNMSKIELLEANYRKEIELLKKKHDSETQALLEGFEVKLNFERKLNKLKVKQ